MSLEALERSDLARLPGGIFTRAFIRAYAQEVGLDPDRTIHDFLAELPPEAVAAAARQTMIEDGEKLESDRKAATTAIRLVLVSVPIVGLVMYWSTHRPPGVPAAPVSVQRSVVAREAVHEASPAVAPVVVPSGLTMEIAPKAACWVSVTVDGEPTFSGVMNAGERRQVSARDEVLVTVGDAGAFAYTLNGQSGKPFGAPGEVVSKRINLSNYKDLLIP
jgi:cytoskeletal protein RodZ